jgi:hypothetical protein
MRDVKQEARRTRTVVIPELGISLSRVILLSHIVSYRIVEGFDPRLVCVTDGRR